MFSLFLHRFGLPKNSTYLFKTLRKTCFVQVDCSTFYTSIRPNSTIDSSPSSAASAKLTRKGLNQIEANLIWEDVPIVQTKKIRGFDVENFLISTISNLRLQGEQFSLDKCAQLRSDIVKIIGSSNERFLDSSLFAVFNQNDDWIRYALSYVEYLLKENLFNPASIRIATDLIFKAFTQRQLTVDDQFTLNFVEYLNTNGTHFNENTYLLKFVCSLCTSKWNDSLVALSADSKLKSSRYVHHLAAIVCFMKDEPELGFNVLRRCLEEKMNHYLTKPIFDAAFNCLIRITLKDKRRALKCFQDLVQLCRDHNSTGFHPDSMPDMLEFFKNLEMFDVVETQISVRGRCHNCSQNLENVSISDEEFELLKNYLFKDLLIGKDVFRSSTEVEVDRFKKFLKTHNSYDVVIDGLNVLYQITRASRALQYERLIEMIDQLNSKNLSKICIFFRKHVKNTFRQLTDLEKKVEFYFLDNKSLDDLFLLYTAATSGSKCYIVSRDKFSFVNTNLSTNGQFPRQYVLKPQMASKGFHIPIVKPRLNAITDKDFWLCVQPTKNKRN